MGHSKCNVFKGLTFDSLVKRLKLLTIVHSHETLNDRKFKTTNFKFKMLNSKMVTNTRASKHVIFVLITDVIYYRGTQNVNWTFSMIMFYFFQIWMLQ